jgi:hypothetical protein
MVGMERWQEEGKPWNLGKSKPWNLGKTTIG